MAAWNKTQKAALEFYAVALAREELFVDNLIKQMETDDLNIAVLIAGGFHTSRIKELLRARNVSYAVIRPKMTVRSARGLYAELMAEAADDLLARYTAATPADPADSGRFAGVYVSEAAVQVSSEDVAGLANIGRERLAGEVSLFGAIALAEKQAEGYRQIFWSAKNTFSNGDMFDYGKTTPGTLPYRNQYLPVILTKNPLAS